jgi:hypothetical protein
MALIICLTCQFAPGLETAVFMFVILMILYLK